ncbi:MAG: acetate--CoA ligase family protein [Smithellaceae bacterium]
MEKEQIAEKIIGKAKTGKRLALTEAESKQILAQYGIPVVEETVALTQDDAVKAAETFGYPVVLKGLGSKLTHKTERGLVYLNLLTREAVLAAVSDIGRLAGGDLEGYLVQKMIRGRREFVAGLFCDEQFGPVVMFGLGGIFTEALDDVVFRVAPLNQAQAEAMLDELHSAKLLGSLRGEAALNREKIIEVLLGLSRLAIECPDIVEVDVNPLVADATGELTAVDALIVLGKRIEKRLDRPQVDPQDIFKIFAPRSIAFIGASSNIMKWGYRLLATTVTGNYAGEIYLVNPNNADIAGRKVYKTVLDIPGKVDLAVVTIPASQVSALIPDMKKMGIRYMLLISSGFAETGQSGVQLEKELVAAAEDAGILIIGPNTMGFNNPHAKLCCMGTASWPKPGSIGLVAQSGNLGAQLIIFAEQQNIGLRVFCGSGNEAMVTIEDYMGAFEVEDVTKTVVLYVESAKDGKRFLQQAGRLSRKKPVILLKGGRTEAGNAAAASHTGAMASNIRVFNAACHQAGIILAKHPIELLDFSAAFSSLPLPDGNRVGLITFGGGWGVVATDECAESGLAIPPLSKDIISRIDKILPLYWNRGNPVDIVGEVDFDIPTKIVEMLAEWDGCDAIIHLGIMGRHDFVENFGKAYLKLNPELKELLALHLAEVDAMEKKFVEQTIRLMEKYRKPILGVKLRDNQGSEPIAEIEGSEFKPIAFPTPERAVNALAAMVRYDRWLKREGIQK